MKKIINYVLIVTMLLGMITLTGCGIVKKDINNNTEKQIINKNQSKVSGYSYIEKTDDSLLNLNNDGSFEYYKDKDELSDYYYVGTYRFVMGNELKNAIEQSNDSNLDVIKSSLNKMDDEKLENLCCLVLKSEKQFINHINILTEPTETVYLGSYDETTNTISVVNMKSGNLYNFVRSK